MSFAPRPDVTRREGFLKLARWYVRGKLRRSFDGVYLEGAERVRALAAQGPLLIASNHVAWWDPLLAVRIDEALGTESYALMDRQNLGRLPFFGWLGAIPLDRTNARDSLAQLRAAATLLDGPGKVVWIFAQGEQRPAHLRPLGMKSGIAVLAEAAAVPIVPLAVNYLFRQTEQPAAFATFGEPILASGLRRRSLVHELEAAVEKGLAAIDTFATTGAGNFVELAAPTRRGDTPALAKLLAPRSSSPPAPLRTLPSRGPSPEGTNTP